MSKCPGLTCREEGRLVKCPTWIEEMSCVSLYVFRKFSSHKLVLGVKLSKKSFLFTWVLQTNLSMLFSFPIVGFLYYIIHTLIVQAWTCEEVLVCPILVKKIDWYLLIWSWAIISLWTSIFKLDISQIKTRCIILFLNIVVSCSIWIQTASIVLS